VCTLWGEPAERWTIAGIARFLRVEQGDDVLEAIRHLDAYLSRRCETVLVRDVSNMWRELNGWV
jgi:predicted Zn-ribbon and HTH transcriptional regulator